VTNRSRVYDAAVAADPDYHEAHYHRGSTLLLNGRYEEGWRDFEHRWQVADCGFDRPALNAAEWRGESLQGRSIVVYSEQGLGDTIQFARYLPELAQRGGTLTFLCHPNLMRLFKTLTEGFEVTASVDGNRRFDVQCALMSLPMHLGMPAPRARAGLFFGRSRSDRPVGETDRHSRVQDRDLLAGQPERPDRRGPLDPAGKICPAFSDRGRPADLAAENSRPGAVEDAALRHGRRDLGRF
jgi:hypothetical protein